MNGLTAARGLRRSVEGSGGVMRISVNALGDAFGRGRLTPRARAGIDQVLARAGLEVRPSLTEAGDDWVTLRVVAPAPGGGGRAGDGPAVLRAVADEVRLLPRPRVPASLAAALALVVPVLVASAVVLPAGGDARAPRGAAPAAAPVTLLDEADAALLAADYKQAVALMRRADPARVPRLREQIVAALLHQARVAQRSRAYPRAIRLARRASRFGRAPGAARIVRQATAGLELRRGGRARAPGPTRRR